MPKDANGYQDGNWTLTALKLWDVFAADGTEYTETMPLEIDVSGTNNVTKVVSRLNVKFTEDKSQDFGKDASGNVTGVFMDSYNVSGIAVDITDFEGQVVQNVGKVTLKFTYGNNSATHGGYSGITNADADFTIALTDDGSGTHFVQSGSHTLRYAGSYTTTFSFTVGGKPQNYSGESLPVNTPKFTVSSVTPAVKITSAYYKDKSADTQSSFTDTSTTVYYRETTEVSCGITYYNYGPANVTITLSGYGNASGATLEFKTSNSDGKVHLYEESQKDDGTSTNAYTWTGDGNCLRYMGYWESKTGSDEKAAAGTLTATELALTFNGVTYKVDVTDITINNPS